MDRRGRRYSLSTLEPPQLAAVPVPKVTAMTRLGRRLYLGAAGHVFAFDLPLRNDSAASWKPPIDGMPVHLVAAGDRLLVSTREGRLVLLRTKRSGERGA